MHIANTRIKNEDNIETEIGDLEYLIPSSVVTELERLARDPRKGAAAGATLEYIRRLARIELPGLPADDAILGYVRRYGGIVATMDVQLKTRIKDAGGSVLSIHNDHIILEQ